METDRALLMFTCVASTLTLLCVAIATLPRMKEGMVVVRDATLWVVFALIVGGLGWGLWQNVQRPDGRKPIDWLLLPTSTSAASPADSPVEDRSGPASRSEEPAPDPYYRRVDLR